MDSQLQDTLPATPIQEVLKALNERQKAPAISDERNIIVVAGAGTGKTKTMEARTAYLVANGVEPKRIMALSFTNESSKEFEDRIKDVCGYAGHLVNTGTFHAIFNRVLRIYSNHDFFKSKLGYPDGFFIIDDDDMKRLMSESIKGLPSGLSKLASSIYKPKEALSGLSLLRSKCYTASSFAKTIVKNKALAKQWMGIKQSLNADDSDHNVESALGAINTKPQLKDFLLVQIWDSYSKRCRASNAIDFDDVLLNTYFLFKSNPEICKKFALSIDHCLIDEYQDTNPVQALIIKLMKDQNPNLSLFIVGDGRQAIYDFRGSDVSLMTNADKYFGDFAQFELVTNYRSSNTVIESSNLFAKTMVNQRTDGQLECGNPSFEQHLMESHYFSSDLDEAKWVVNTISLQLQEGIKPEDIYVIYRNRAAARAIENLMQEQHIQFEMVGERDFYECADVRDSLAFLRTLTRPKDVLAWARLCQCMPVPVRGIWLRDKHMQAQLEEGKQVMPRTILESRMKEKKAGPAIEEWLSFYDLSSKALKLDDSQLLEVFVEEQVPDGITLDDVQYQIETEVGAASAYNAWKEEFFNDVTHEVCELFIEKVYPSYLKLDTPKKNEASNAEDDLSKTQARLDRIRIVFDELRTRLNAGQSFVDIVDDLLTRDAKRRQDTTSSVKLLTGHASKGLESRYCYLVGCDTAIWQLKKDLSPKELDEASRLYYVMSSRAKEQNIFTFANSRYMYDKTVASKPFGLINKHMKALEHAGLLKSVNHAQPMNRQSHSSNDKLWQQPASQDVTVENMSLDSSEVSQFRSRLQKGFTSQSQVK